ncbi:MAG TPA: phosphoribosylpyrophosphate synthetase [Chitinophagaceae bacterium]|nr:phosphoribosylpyrophosphate synthetase [Chitinophagaceae bacterium]
MKSYESLIEALDDLKKRGYEADFELQSNCLYCNTLDLRLYEEDFNIDEVYRFEGESNPDDSAVVYAMTSPTGVKGTIVDGYGASASNISFEFARKLQNHPATVTKLLING